MSKLTKVLITGASGLLGANLVRHYAGRADCTGFYGKNPISISGADLKHLELTDRQSVSRAIKQLRPDLIIHCAAATNVEWCEKHPDLAKTINEDVAIFLAELSSETGAKFVFMSTDSVFDGNSGNYLESDTPGPLNSYATGKVRAEEAVNRLNPDTLVIRSYFYGHSPSGTRSLLEWVACSGYGRQRRARIHRFVFFSDQRARLRRRTGLSNHGEHIWDSAPGFQ